MSANATHRVLANLWQCSYQERLKFLETTPTIAGQFRAELYRRRLTDQFNAMMTEQYRQARPDTTKSDHEAGWKTIGGGASVYINKEGIITAGCPGLKGEDIDDIEDESDESRDERQQRQNVAESKGIEGEEISSQGAQQLDEQQPEPFNEQAIKNQLAINETASYGGKKAKIIQHPDGLGYAVQIEQDGETRILAGKYPQVSWQDAQGFAITALRGDDSVENQPQGAKQSQPVVAQKTPPQAQSRFQRAVADAVADHGVDPTVLTEAAREVFNEKSRQLADREAAKMGVRKLTGLNQRDIGRMENAGFDLSSAGVGGKAGQKLRQFDVWATEAARQYPELELGDPDDPRADLASNLWDVLREGKQAVPPIWHPDIINDAANMASMATVGAGDFGGEEFSRPGRAEHYARMFRREIEARKVVARYQRTAISGIYLG